MNGSWAPALHRGPLLFSDETPHRLCKYEPPFGIRHAAINLTSCLELALTLKRQAANGTRPPSLQGSCAVVGNSGTLLGSGQGVEIDAHDSVGRINAAPSGGVWSADVGGRSTLRLLTDWTGMMLKRHPGDTRTSGEGILLYCMASWTGKCHRLGTLPPSASRAKRWLVSPLLVRRLRELLFTARASVRPTVLPSAGLLAIAIATRTCSHIDLYGFGDPLEANHTEGGDDWCEHYYECLHAGSALSTQRRYFSSAHPTNPGGRHHDWLAQWQLIRDLTRAAQGSVRLRNAETHAKQGKPASEVIEDRWMRQFKRTRPLVRSRRGAHFPPAQPVY
jgi:hypothetical protein